MGFFSEWKNEYHGREDNERPLQHSNLQIYYHQDHLSNSSENTRGQNVRSAVPSKRLRNLWQLFRNTLPSILLRIPTIFHQSHINQTFPQEGVQSANGKWS